LRRAGRDVLAHPRTADFLRDAVGFLGGREVEQQDEMLFVDLEHARREPSGINGQPDTITECLNGGFAHRVAKVEVVNDDVHARAFTVEVSLRPRSEPPLPRQGSHDRGVLSSRAFGGRVPQAATPVLIASSHLTRP
jgi:hypothetical protein